MSEERQGMTRREIWFVCFPTSMPDPPLVVRKPQPRTLLEGGEGRCGGERGDIDRG